MNLQKKSKIRLDSSFWISISKLRTWLLLRKVKIVIHTSQMFFFYFWLRI